MIALKAWTSSSLGGEPVATDRSSGSALPGILQGALSAWAESEQREIHPESGTSGPASQAAAREMLRRAQAEGR